MLCDDAVKTFEQFLKCPSMSPERRSSRIFKVSIFGTLLCEEELYLIYDRVVPNN